ncbi:MAG: hypothetical protein KatS3mg071_1731 [Meiothermus sp.]|nr:MAG: hypothetical protein KatS3mg071_1731 [Meiothermus sp.]
MHNRRERIEEMLDRLERAEAYLEAGRVHRVEGLPQTYVVEGTALYLVNTGDGECTCPDAEKGHACKHLLASILLERSEQKVPKPLRMAV